ncbi:MAG TPA: hypothetical protein VJZ27_00915 [Aggregatilineales bacterium]|nr:hypothetical protein [Aggregatilineales bacterium]
MSEITEHYDMKTAFPRFMGYLFALTILLSACGGGIDAPETLPADFTVAQGDRVALAIPAEWTAIQPTPEDFRAVADRLRNSNPLLATKIDDMAKEIRDDTLRLAAYHADGYTNLNIAAERAAFFQTAEVHAAANRDGLKEVGYEILETASVEINGQKAARTEAEIRLFTPQGEPYTFRLLQYTLVSGGTAYSISFGTPAIYYAEFESQFEQIASTFYTFDD